MPIKERINVLLLNDAGTGFPERVEAPKGKKLEEFLNEYVENFVPEEYYISVNGGMETQDYELQDGDRVIVTKLNSKITSGR